MSQPIVILVIVAVIAVIAFMGVLVNKLHSQQKYKAKVKAGIIKEGETPQHVSEADNQKKLDDALQLLQQRHNGDDK